MKRNEKPDKYAQLKNEIKKIFVQSNQTYGYRRIQLCTERDGFKASPDTILKLMNEIGIRPNMYSRHTSKYRSYKGKVGKTAPNILKQHFNATQPLSVLHTDVTQVRLTNQKWAYISAIIDEASRRVLAVKISNHPDKKLIKATLDSLKPKLPDDTFPILHSDQGWQYQIKSYRYQLLKMHIIQSMSRKGNCHDNAPIESWFSLLKRECLYRHNLKSLVSLRRLVSRYVKWFNTERITLIHDGLTPVGYCQKVLAA